MSFSKNVVSEILLFSNLGVGGGLTSLTLVVKKSTVDLSGESILEKRQQNLKLNVALIFILLLKSKALIYDSPETLYRTISTGLTLILLE